MAKPEKLPSVIDIPESEWQTIPFNPGMPTEWFYLGTRVGAVEVLTKTLPAASGLGYQTRVFIGEEQPFLLSDVENGHTDSVTQAFIRHRQMCWYWAKAERQAEARARIKGRRD